MDSTTSWIATSITLFAAAMASATTITPRAMTHVEAPLLTQLLEASEQEMIPVILIPAGFDAAATIGAVPAAGRLSRSAVISTLKTTFSVAAAPIMAALDAQGDAIGRRPRVLWINGTIATSMTPAAVRRLAMRSDLAEIRLDRQAGMELFPVLDFDNESSGSVTAATECGVDLMNAPAVWSTHGITGAGVVVGVIDTGACIGHPDLSNQIWNNPGEIAGNGIDDDGNGYIDDITGWNFRDDTSDHSDEWGHGTHVSGSVLGDGAQGTATGVAPDAELMTLKFWNNFSGESVVWEAIQYGADNGADVISGSFGWPHSWTTNRDLHRQACESAIAAGVTCIFASGNEGSGSPPDNVRTPGDVPDVITVGAVDCSDNLAGFSSTGPVTWESIAPWFDHPYPPGLIKPDVAGPGVDTESTHNSCSGYTTMSGTSMATPHVAGAAALVIQANSSLTPAEVKAALMNTAVDLGVAGIDNEYGAGRVDALAAVESVLAPPCGGDVNGDGSIDVADILQLLNEWGPCAGCQGDLNGDGIVGVPDLLVVLDGWGPC
jgi:serine protease AprX